MQLNAKQKRRNLLLTLVQYSMLVAFLVAGPWLAENTWLIGIQLLGFVLGVWGIMVMQESRINIAPRPREGAKLIQKGPYRLIRHPMYLAILLFFVPLLIDDFSWPRFVILMVLTPNLILKLLFEESLLKMAFPEYDNYMQKSWRLIPWVF
jgi:protein-S-isoprenylcysteine O-methyltransferase Ste14